jgi:hypothetical protein
MFIHFVEDQQSHVGSSSSLQEKIQRFVAPPLGSR